MSIQEELELIRNQNLDGILYAEDVVKYAQTNKASELHQRFNWDVKEAAYAYWLLTARNIIRVHFTVVKEAERGVMRAYFSPQPTESDAPASRGYIPIQEILADPERRRHLLFAQLDRLSSVLASYELPELKPVAAAIQKCRLKYSIRAEAAE